MSPLEILTPPMKKLSCAYCASCRTRDEPSSWSRTTLWWPGWPTAALNCTMARAHNHKPFINPCHDALKPMAMSTGDGSMIVELTARGRQKAADIIRRHRLAERLFTDSLAMDSETEIEQQACKFEHILSHEATDKICTFLGHPRTCPHGAPIPPGACCGIENKLAPPALQTSTYKQ